MSLDSTKADDIALVIEEAIVSGELAPGNGAAPGAALRAVRGLAHADARGAAPARRARLVSFVPNRGVRVRTISREELHEAFMVRAELEGLATEVAAAKITPEELAELEAAELHFASISQELRSREPGDGAPLDHGRLGAREHAFHDVIYSVADLPLVEQLAKGARRSFSGPAVGRRATTRSTACTRRTPSSTAPSARRSRRAAARALAHWRASTSSRRSTCSRPSSSRSEAPGHSRSSATAKLRA